MRIKRRLINDSEFDFDAEEFFKYLVMKTGLLHLKKYTSEMLVGFEIINE